MNHVPRIHRCLCVSGESMTNTKKGEDDETLKCTICMDMCERPVTVREHEPIALKLIEKLLDLFKIKF